MACFTTEHVLQIPAPPDLFFGRSCLIGDDIWVLRHKKRDNVEMWRFDTKTKQCEKIEHNDRNRGKFSAPNHGFDFTIFGSNGKLYMRSFDSAFDSRLLEFDTSTLEWKILMEFESEHFSRGFALLGRDLYTTFESWNLQISNLDTFQTTAIDFPRIKRNRYQDHFNICELNGSLYLIGIKRPYWRSIYRYDTDGSTFVDIKKKDSMDWACQMFGNHLPRMEIFMWSNNNKIYQAFQTYKKDRVYYEKENLQLVIDYFDVDTKQWHTVFQSKYQKQITNVFGDSDNNVYVITDKRMYSLIREIDLDPSLQNISLVQLADTSVANFYTENYVSLTMKLPCGLRDKYDNMITWKLQETRLGRLEHMFGLIEKWEVDIDKIVAKRFNETTSEEEKSELDRKWEKTNNVQQQESTKFLKLMKEYDWILGQQKKYVVDEQILRQVEYRRGRFEALNQRFKSWSAADWWRRPDGPSIA